MKHYETIHGISRFIAHIWSRMSRMSRISLRDLRGWSTLWGWPQRDGHREELSKMWPVASLRIQIKLYAISEGNEMVDDVHNCHITRIPQVVYGKGPLCRLVVKYQPNMKPFVCSSYMLQRSQAIRTDHVLMRPNCLFAWFYTKQTCDLVLLTHRGVYREIYRVREALVRLYLGLLGVGPETAPPGFSIILLNIKIALICCIHLWWRGNQYLISDLV